ncbi:hypothetical protein CALCODRAFT_512834 [Calocera cornea HHB12733]|uniref:Uncharacterized protein n=1 Tax=Calocera cornea HHB12733 TaxID=1353952 RepID=A0A165CQV3_9BASI|nr:hypothetical protein CALCODRAFT_512834 [Calocera cornea HHB12733]
MYIMGWGDILQSHNYIAFHGGAAKSALCNVWPQLHFHCSSHTSTMTSNVDDTYQSSSRNAPDNNDSVYLEQQSSGGLTSETSQIQQYMHCGADLEGWNLVNFIVNTYEETFEEVSISSSGCPRNRRSLYNSSYKFHDSCCWVHHPLDHNTLPSFVGKWPPQSNNKSQFELYCTSMLLLFKPWRSLADLLLPNTTVQQSFSSFESSTTEEALAMMSNMQYFYNCQVPITEQMQAVDMSNTIHSMHDDALDSSGSDMDDNGSNYLSFNLEHWSETDWKILEASQHPERDLAFGWQAVQIGESARLFPTGLHSWSPMNGVLSSPDFVSANIAMQSVWESALVLDVQSSGMANCEPLNFPSSTLIAPTVQQVDNLLSNPES